MNVEQELIHWLDSHIPDNRVNKRRDAKAVLLHYGFGDSAWPTLEQIGQQLSIGIKERVRQVLNSNFRDKASIDQLPVLGSTLKEIRSTDFSSVPEIRRRLMDAGLISSGTHIRGLLNIASDLNVFDDYRLVDHNLNNLFRSKSEFDGMTFVGRKNTIREFKRTYKKAKVLPGQLGLARFEYIRDALGDESAADRIMEFIELNAEAEKVRHGDEKWYVFENRQNVLVNSCEKIFSVTRECEVQILASTLRNSLQRRTQKYRYPGTEVILKWIHQSRWFEVNNGVATFLGQAEPLLKDIESAVVHYLSEREICEYHELKGHLMGLGFGKHYTEVTVTGSPLVYVDKSGGRCNYHYSLISNASATVLQGGPMGACRALG